jgi:hypothetical protein
MRRAQKAAEQQAISAQKRSQQIGVAKLTHTLFSFGIHHGAKRLPLAVPFPRASVLLRRAHRPGAASAASPI